jgi:hypothetical protein
MTAGSSRCPQLKLVRRLRATLRVTVSDLAGNRRVLSRRMEIRR